MRSLVYFIARCFDRLETAATEDVRAHCQGLCDLLTPLVKAYCAQRGFEVCVQAIQVYGGYGYTRDYPVEQLARDCKIASIYEGTDGIQAMDLLGRKLGMNKGAVFDSLMDYMDEVITTARGVTDLAPLADALEKTVGRLGETAFDLTRMSRSAHIRTAYAHAFPFLDAMGDVVMAWMLLWRASIAQEKLGRGAGKKDAAFFEGQVKSAEFFIRSILPVTNGKLEAIRGAVPAAVEISEAAFGGL